MYSAKNRTNSKIYLPKNAVNLVYSFYHNSIVGGHLGIAETQEKICEHFYRPDLRETIRTKVLDCLICNMSKVAQRKYEGKLVSVPIENSLDCLFVDLLGPLVKTKDQRQYILVVVDGYSRFT